MAEPTPPPDGIAPGAPPKPNFPRRPDHPPFSEDTNNLIERAVREGRSTLMVRSNNGGRDGNERGFQDVYEKGDTRRGRIIEILDSPGYKAYNAGFDGDPKPLLIKHGVNEVLIVSDLSKWRGNRGGQPGHKTWYEGRKGSGGPEGPWVERPISPGTGAQMAIYYRVDDNTSPGGENYPDGAGRTGNYLDLELVVPMGLGEELVRAIGHRTSKNDPTVTGDPTLIRRIIDASVRQKFSKEFIEDWDKFSRPPWEKLDALQAQRGQRSRMYIANLITRPSDYRKPYVDNITEYGPQQETAPLKEPTPRSASPPPPAAEKDRLADVRNRLGQLARGDSVEPEGEESSPEDPVVLRRQINALAEHITGRPGATFEEAMEKIEKQLKKGNH